MAEFTKDQLKKAVEQFISHGVDGFYGAKIIIGDKIAAQLLKIFIQNTKKDMINHFGKLYSTEEENNIINNIIEEIQKSENFDPLSHILNFNLKNE